MLSVKPGQLGPKLGQQTILKIEIGFLKIKINKNLIFS